MSVQDCICVNRESWKCIRYYNSWMVYVGRAHLEASAERWSRLLGLLEELWRWICMKDEELAKQMPIGGDVPTLLQQQNHCTVRTTATGNVPNTF